MIVVALLAAGSALFMSATAAHAATGVTTTVLQNGNPVQPGAEIHTGDSLKLRMQYDPTAVGQTVTVALGANVTVSDSFPNNEAVESVTASEDGKSVVVKFKDPWPAIQDGILDLDLVYTSVETSGPGDLTWNDGTEHTVPVVFVKTGDQKENVGDGFAKAVTPGNLDSYVLKDADGNYQGLNPDITGQNITYTLTVNTPDGATRGPDFPVADVLPDGLAYVQPLAVTATETTWDENGYNAVQGDRTFTVDSQNATHDSFNGHVDGTLTGPSVLKLTYTVRVDDVAALNTALQAKYDDRKPSPGRYEIELPNTATFGGDATATATVKVGASILGPCVSCGKYGKSGDLTTANVLTDDDGNIVPDPVDLNYTLRANLGDWDGHSANYVLDDNFVIEDNLLSQASWKTGAGFLAVTGSGPISSLTSAGTCPATAALFADDANVGKYCLDGNKLMINVGKNAATNITIAAPAQLNTVTGLPTDGNVENGDRYRVRNTATFNWGSQHWTTPNVDGYVVVPEAENEGVDDASAFAKLAPASVTAGQNQATQVPYTFSVNTARTGVPAASTRIVDHVDTRYFDLAPDLSNVSVAGGYTAGNVSLGADGFTLTRTGDDLTIALSASGQSKVAAPGGTLTVNLTLTTRVFDGKETIDITNSADLYDDGTGPLYVSRVQSQGTSFGAESETRKHIFDPAAQDGAGEWTQLLTDDEGKGKVYVYRLQYIAHPGFGGVAITTVNDVLPEGLEFLGFVDETAKATGANPQPGPVNIPEGNLVATFVPAPAGGASGTVQVSQQADTTIPEGSISNVYFAARVTDDEKSIVNDFGISSTTLVPRGPSIDIEKWAEDGENPGPQYDESGALTNDGYDGDFDRAPGKTLTAGKVEKIRFTVSNDGPEALRDVKVSDKLDSGAGRITGLECTFPGSTEENPITGTEWDGPFEPGARFECEGILPALKAGENHADTATVTGVGVLSGVEVDDADEWHGSVPAVVATLPNGMPVTGGQAATGAIALAMLGMAGGGLLLMRRRRATA